MNKYEKAWNNISGNVIHKANLLELVEKATPKPLIIISVGEYNTPIIVCDNCGKQPNLHTKDPFCSVCGQSLDWSKIL